MFHANAGVVSGMSQTLDSIYDGAGNTIMFTENLNAGIGSWSNPDPLSCTFFFPFANPADDSTSTLATPKNDTTLTGAFLTPYINQNKEGPEGMSPFPSSNHPGGVAICTGEGGARFLSEDINQEVYVKLITPSATRLRGNDANGDPIPVERPLKETF